LFVFVSVRRNALTLLIDVFPLHNPSNTTDELLQQQFDILISSLNDNDSNIRTLGIQGICKIINIYWELIPLNIIKTMILKLINDMIHDISCSNIRVAIFKGLTFILSNHLSHTILNLLIPSLSPFIHDKCEQVQLSFIDMLITIKQLKNMKFYEICELEQLLLW
jgi:condensin-2 complex subunit G2